MANKPPDVRLTGIRASIPPGYLLGRVSAGIGGVELISVGKAQSAGLIPSTLPGPPTGAAGGDLSGTYPNPTVAQLQGVAVQAGTPTNLAVLLYHTAGATWLPVVLGAVAYSNAYSDLSGLPTIHSVIAGGTAGQVLTKNSGTDYDLTWTTPSSGGGSSGAASIQDDGTNLYIAMSDTDGQLVLDGGGDPIFSKEVLPASSIPPIKGVTDGSNAAAGVVGEYLHNETLFAARVAATTGTAADLFSITLTPGDWDVEGSVAFFPVATTQVTNASGWINNTSATSPLTTRSAGGFFASSIAYTSNGTVIQYATGKIRYSVTINTVIYLSYRMDFTVSTATVFGSMNARRVR